MTTQTFKYFSITRSLGIYANTFAFNETPTCWYLAPSW